MTIINNYFVYPSPSQETKYDEYEKSKEHESSDQQELHVSYRHDSSVLRRESS